MDAIVACLPLLIGWTLDLLLGDPASLPHPVVGMGKAISVCEHTLNHGRYRRAKGAICAVALITGAFLSTWLLLQGVQRIGQYAVAVVEGVLIFYCLSGTTLIREVSQVFHAVDCSLEQGRRQVARIVGRDTSRLSAHEIRTAALETLAENLSDGVVAPLFWYALLGVPGMVAYKMVNTLDSMIGYRNERYRRFGTVAARIDDVANYVPARITAMLMVMVAGTPRLLAFVKTYGRRHLSPNSGYPEAALAGILDCRFGGPHDYFGESVYKPYIGTTDRALNKDDVDIALAINRRVEVTVVLAVMALRALTAALL